MPRIAIGLPLYLAGERYPKFTAGDRRSANYNEVGNAILYNHGHYLRNLYLARLGSIPFLLLASSLVFIWTRDEFGDATALTAVALFMALPIILAFSTLAYTDLAAACMQFAAFYAVFRWLKSPSKQNIFLLGAACGLAVLSNFSALIFVPSAALAMYLCKRFVGHRHNSSEIKLRRWAISLASVALIAAATIWGGYKFSFGHIREASRITPDSIPSFQHFPGIVRGIARRSISSDWVIPVPALIQGLAAEWVQSRSSPPAYLLGETKSGGWWYFFPAAFAVKTPFPFIVLVCIGSFGLWRIARTGRWEALCPLACVISIFVVTMPVRYDAGLRHILVVFPLLAMVAGVGALTLWQLKTGRLQMARIFLLAVLLWQVVASFAAAPDYLAYFNELAGRDPSKVLLTGCDLDCGQDLVRLTEDLNARKITHFSIAIWSSADLLKMNLPHFEVLQPFKPTQGWIAISVRSQIFGDVFHSTYPAGAFSWLQGYKPVEQIGKTIRLYYIPES